MLIRKVRQETGDGRQETGSGDSRLGTVDMRQENETWHMQQEK